MIGHSGWHWHPSPTVAARDARTEEPTVLSESVLVPLGSVNRTEEPRTLSAPRFGFVSVPDLGSINRTEEKRGTENFVGSGSRFSVLGSCISQAGSDRHCATRGSESRA